jgi:hypothetical protein
MRVLPFLSALALVAIHGCGLELSGTSTAQPPVDASTDATTPSLDAGGDVELDAPPEADTPDTGAEGNCFDNIDNDGDGLIDCADPECSPVAQCVPDAPTGWQGPALYLDTRDACPTSFPTTVNTFETLAPGNATCSSCSCAASGATCTLNLPFECKKSQNCDSNPSYNRTTTADNSCYDGGPGAPGVTFETDDYCRLVASQINSAGTCSLVAGGGQITKQTPQYQKQSRVCRGAVTGGGCSAGQTCVARPTAHGYCVSQAVADGQSPPACPAGYAQAHTTSPLANAFTDTRACTACGCSGQPVNATCAAVHRVFTSDNCSGNPAAQVNGDGVCRLVTNQTFLGRSARTSVTVTQGTCASTGGVVTGAVTQNNVTQVCCQN